MDDLLLAQGADRSPRRHRRVGKDDARIPDELIEILVRQFAVADRGLVGSDTAGRPHVIPRDQMAPGAGAFVPIEKERAALLRIARNPGRHRHPLDRWFGTRVVVGIRTEVEVERRPAPVPSRRAFAVGQRLKVAARFGNGARGPLREASVVGHVRDRPGAAGAQRDERGPSRQQQRWRAPHRGRGHENLMSAVPSYRPPVVSRNWTLSWPGSVALKVKEKNGFSATLCVVSKVTTVLPR